MYENIYKYLAIFVIGISFSISKAEATTIPPQPVYRITAEVLSADIVESSVGEFIDLYIEITNKPQIVKDTKDKWPTSVYKKGFQIKVVVYIERDFVDPSTELSAGDNITGEIEFFGAEEAQGYILSNIQKIE